MLGKFLLTLSMTDSGEPVLKIAVFPTVCLVPLEASVLALSAPMTIPSSQPSVTIRVP
jgi:hypothetical protein